jgi:hypothetical protein
MKPQKKQTQKSSQSKQPVNAAPTNREIETPQADNTPEITAPPVVTPEAVTPPANVPPAATPAPEKAETPKKEKAPSISTVVRRLVVENPDKTLEQITALLIATGWDAADVEKRKSTIITLRTDALGILKIAKECGWSKK